jgi:septum formation protein
MKATFNNQSNAVPAASGSIILASQSPRRKQLLEWAEVPFEVIVKETDESYPPQLSVEDIAVHIARNKALAIQKQNLTLRPVLAADTIVVLGEKIIGKPRDRQDAIDILSGLSGQKHRVITGVVILYNDSETAFADITEVEFHELTHEQIVFYVDKYKPYDKAGAYAIQEWIGVVGIKTVTGDFYNVMGLPVSRVVQELKKAGILSM